MSERALVIVPTYNERENIRPLIESVLSKDARIDMLIVDDGSPDGTGAIVDEIAAANSRVSALHRPSKLGLGTAYLEGFRWALARSYDYVFEMDADFSHNPDHLPEFLRRIEDADLVLGSRYRNGRVTVVNWPLRSRRRSRLYRPGTRRPRSTCRSARLSIARSRSEVGCSRVRYRSER